MSNYTPNPSGDQSQQQYAAPQVGYAGYAQPEPKTLSIIALVGGIAGLTVLPFVGSIAGLICAVMAKTREPAGRTFATWGFWLSIVGLVLGVLGVILIIAFYAAIFSAVSSGSY